MKNKSNSIYNYIIYALIFIIVLLVIVVLTTNNKSTDKIQETPTPILSVINISLKGDSEISIIKGQTYQEPGYTAHDSYDGDLTNRVSVEGNVDTNVVGSYTITYRVTNSNGKTKETTRIINVLEDLTVEIDYSPKELTKDNVTITLKISGDCLDYTIAPDGHRNMTKELEYNVSSNDEYQFSIFRTDGQEIKKSIKINNIDKQKPTGTCKNTVTNEKTIVEVNAKDESGIKQYSYNYNNKNINIESNTYTINEMVSNVSVTIYDKAENTETIKCQKIDESWPVIADQNYQDHAADNYNPKLTYGKTLNYILYYPNNLDLNEKNALVIFLHGLGEFGTNIFRTISQSSAFAYNMKMGRFQQKAIFLAPQCKSSRTKWVDCFDDLKGLIDDTIKKYNIDPNRVTMTGHSLGGEAVFNFIVKYPGFLAAAAPLAPSRINSDYTKMLDLKIAVFTGTSDGLFEKNKNWTNNLIKNGVNLKFYPLQNVSHSSQKALFNGTNIIDWLISQSK